jgi:hypothetical protein
MAPDAQAQDLLYVTNSKTITVYSYPGGKLEGQLKFGNSPAGECVDKKGDVFVTNLDDRQIVEYAHGIKKPILVQDNPTSQPAGCAIDPTTGNLAVSSLGFGSSSPGTVAIYRHAHGIPVTYQNSDIEEFFLCGYDDKGNLFVDGLDFDGQFKFAELPKGGTTITSVTLNQGIVFPGGVQWDGKYVAVGDQNYPVIYQFTIKGSSGTEVGKISLGSDAWDVFQFFILGRRVIAPNECKPSQCYPGDVLFFSYPAGGTATKTITNSVRYPGGAVVSKADVHGTVRLVKSL